MSVIVVTFGADADGEGFVRELPWFGVLPEAVSVARAGATGEPHDGHRLVVVELEPFQEADATALAVSWGGQLHEPPYSLRVDAGGRGAAASAPTST